MSIREILNRDVLTVIIHNLDYFSLKELSQCNQLFYKLIDPHSLMVKQSLYQYFTDIFKKVIFTSLNCCAICIEREDGKVRIEKCGYNPLGIYRRVNYGKISIKPENGTESFCNEDEFNTYVEEYVPKVRYISLYMYQYDQDRITDIIKPLGKNRYNIRHDQCAGYVYSHIEIHRMDHK